MPRNRSEARPELPGGKYEFDATWLELVEFAAKMFEGRRYWCDLYHRDGGFYGFSAEDQRFLDEAVTNSFHPFTRKFRDWVDYIFRRFHHEIEALKQVYLSKCDFFEGRNRPLADVVRGGSEADLAIANLPSGRSFADLEWRRTGDVVELAQEVWPVHCQWLADERRLKRRA